MKFKFKKAFSFLIAIFTCLIFCAAGCAGGDSAPENQQGATVLPDYYSAYMSAKLGQINFIKENHNIDYSFIFITDLHWDYSAKVSPKLVNYVCENTEIDDTVFGGDYISTDYEEEGKSLGFMKDCVSAFNLTDYHSILGNHDTNINNHGDTAFIPYAQSIAAINKDGAQSSYYRHDSGDICCLYLNTNDFDKGGAQYNWVVSQLCGLSEEKTVFIFMHEYFRSYGKDVTVVENNRGITMAELLQQNADNIKCTVAGIFTGHIHYDYSAVNGYGCRVISTTCDGVDVTPDYDLYFRQRGTITEHAFDVVQVDLTAKKMFLTRIGAGNDRVFGY